nr:MBOAT family O-acyltransferase [uncultured Desulfobulbus sp.]
MVFSSNIFLFLFLPFVLAVYHLLFIPVSLQHKHATKFRQIANVCLLCFSLIFYFWGEGWLIWIIIVSTCVDFFCGLLISGGFAKGDIKVLKEGGPRSGLQRGGLVLSLASNLLLLGFFKYFNFGVDSYNAIVPMGWQLKNVMEVALPLGISFYTFQSMSYTIDVYRGHVKATRSFVNFACFVTLFPQLVAGPIVRYRDIAYQLVHRKITSQLFASGVRRFVLGLGKKVLIANTVSRAADAIFALPSDQVTTTQAWVAVLCFTLQIYYDFSGYSDMAIGLGRMFGFEFLENFNYPYIARSVREFWQRWHISLSTWFRDYLYIPLGGNRKGAIRTNVNLVTVFFLCGLWHGANWAYVAWGLYHGFFLVLERRILRKSLERLPLIVQHGYTLLVVMVGWVLFATESLSQSLVLLKAMLGGATVKTSALMLQDWWTRDILWAIIFGVVFSTPIFEILKRRLCQLSLKRQFIVYLNEVLWVVLVSVVFLFSAMALASGTHNPFIYFRF